MTNDSQLNTQMNKMLNEFNKQREAGFICDTKCQNDQTVRDWQHKVVQKEDTLANASKSLLNAQRQLASYDSSYRPRFNTNINDMADQEIEKLQTQFDTAYDNIIQDLDFYDTQIAFKNSLQDIQQYQQNKLYDISGDVARNIGDVAVNRRKATFYSKETSVLELTISYLQIIYWTLFAIQIIAAVMLATNEKEYSPVLTIVLLAIFPLYNTLYPVLKNFIIALSLFPTP